MTVIAAIAQAGTVVMAADTATNYADTVVHRARKIRRHRAGDAEVLLAYAGHGGLPALMRRDLRLPEPPASDDEGAVQNWAEDVAHAIGEVAAMATPPLTETSNDETSVNGAVLLGWGGRLWWLFTHQANEAADGIAALGSGADVALGVLSTELRYGGDPTKACVAAVEYACTRAPGCYLDASGALVERLGAD